VVPQLESLGQLPHGRPLAAREVPLPITSSARFRRHVGTRGDAAEAVASLCVEAGGLVRSAVGAGKGVQRSVVGDALVRSVGVVELFEHSQRVEHVPVIADVGAVVRVGGSAPTFP
jgi:hypothetical protein